MRTFKNTVNFIILYGAVLLTVSACTNTSEDYVKIISITPSTSKPLYVGSTVSITVEVEYNLNSSSTGSITMVIQRGETGYPSLANEFDVVLKGTGKLKLTKELIIPDTKAIQVFMPLTPEGEQSTSIVDSRLFKVVPEVL